MGGASGTGGSTGGAGAGGEGGATVPEDDCEERFRALDRTCDVDADCRIGTWTECSVYDRTEVFGLRAGALDELEALALECGRPMTDLDCPGEGGGLSPPVTEDGFESWLGGPFAAVACVEKRCTTYSTWCGRDLCGNGVVDQCRVTPGNPPSFEAVTEDPTITEECDGELLGGQTCADLGYASGELVCGSACMLDSSGCAACAPPGGPLLACDMVESGRIGWFVAAASESDLAVLTLGDGGVRLTTYASDLAELRAIDLPIPSDAPYAWGEGTLARADGAWVAVVTRFNPPGYSLYTLPDGGELEEYAGMSGGEYRDPLLIARPGGAPVFVYGLPSDDGFGPTQVVPISDDLRSFGTGRAIGNYPLQSGVWVGGGYLFSSTISGESQLVRLDGDLAQEPVLVPFPTPSPVAELLLGSDGEGAFALARGDGSESSVVRVDAMGARIEPSTPFGTLLASGAPVPLADSVYVAALPPMTELDVSTSVLVVGSDFDEDLQVGEVLARPATDPQAVRLGDELVVLFVNRHGLGIARYAP